MSNFKNTIPVPKEPATEAASRHTSGACQGACGNDVVKARKIDIVRKGTKKRGSHDRALERKLRRMYGIKVGGWGGGVAEVIRGGREYTISR